MLNFKTEMFKHHVKYVTLILDGKIEIFLPPDIVLSVIERYLYKIKTNSIFFTIKYYI